MEDYKKNYKDSMKKIEHLYESVNPECKQIIEYYFPELKESEDERIRKTLINFFSKGAEYDSSTNCIKDRKIIAWLEKQNPKKHEEELEKAYKTADEVQYRKGYEDAKREFEKYANNRPILKENEIKVGDIITYFRDGKKGIMLVSSFDAGIYPRCKWGITHIDGTAYSDWNPGCSVYYAATEEEKQQLYNTMPEYVKDWLKSIKKKHTWKPSKEQMYILNWVANILLNHDGIVEEEASKKLQSLYNDLKKLKGK